jgi:DNA-binding transcriptional ArsR family regulator
MRVELDKSALFALASDSRLEILKALQPSRRTVTQLAEALNIDKGAVHRHLKKLEEGGLVIRLEDHGFVYYGLSWKARDIVSPGENTKIVIVFSCAVLSVLGALAFVALGLQAASRTEQSAGANPSDWQQVLGPSIAPTLEWLLPTLVLAVLAFVLSAYALRRIRRPKSRAAGVEPLAPRPDED